MQPTVQPSFKRFFSFKFLILYLFLFVAAIFIVVGGGIFWGLKVLQKDFGIAPALVPQLISGNTSSLAQDNGRTNILILGTGGKDHEGGDLTDTILVLSVNLKTHDQLLLSIPRDLWIDEIKDRINTVYHYAEVKSAGTGLKSMQLTVQQIIGLPIHYTVYLDFDGFSQMIDELGGIDVAVAQTFTDTQYPITGRENDLCAGDVTFACRYEAVTFTAGVEHMNGERALKYVRSRHAVGDEGTDFSRGARQQAVVKAFKEKTISRQVITNLELLKKLWQLKSSVLTTDMPTDQLLLLSRLIGVSKTQIRTSALTEDSVDNNTKGLLINPPIYNYQGKWVLIPKAGVSDYSQIHQYIACVVANTQMCQINE
jgi:LCP family protein required for cell wall assembly